MFRFLLLFPLLFLFSCTEENEAKQEKKEIKGTTREILQGSWVISRGVGPFADRQVGQAYSFKDNRFQFNKGEIYFLGTVEYEEKSFVITPDKSKIPKRFFYEMKADTMIMKMDGSELTFYLTKIITN